MYRGRDIYWESDTFTDEDWHFLEMRKKLLGSQCIYWGEETVTGKAINLQGRI